MTMSSNEETVLLSRQRNVTPLSAATSRILINEPPFSWKDDVVSVLNRFVQAEPSWDGYLAKPVSFETAYFSLRMLEAIGQNIPESPIITSGSSGDLQFEWERGVKILEVHVRAPNDVCVYRSDEAEIEEEAQLRNNFLVLAEWLKWLSEDRRDVTTAAN
jgi:hypothetical protein